MILYIVQGYVKITTHAGHTMDLNVKGKQLADYKKWVAWAKKQGKPVKQSGANKHLYVVILGALTRSQASRLSESRT